MSHLFHENATIVSVERGAGLDRYGQPLVNTVASDLSCRLERRTSKTISIDGRVATVDGTILLEGFELEVGDKVTMGSGDQWVIFSVDDAQDIFGAVLYREYFATKQRKRT